MKRSGFKPSGEGVQLKERDNNETTLEEVRWKDNMIYWMDFWKFRVMQGEFTKFESLNNDLSSLFIEFW